MVASPFKTSTPLGFINLILKIMSNITNFPNGITSMGVPVPGNGIPVTYGRYIFVDADNGNDGNDGASMGTAVKTLAQAYSLATTNKNDVILLSANATHTLTSMLNVSKNRVHFVGLGIGQRKYGQRARINMGVTTAVTDLFIIQNTGVGNSFINIKFASDNTNANALGTIGEGGEYASYSNCEFYNSTSLTSNTIAELVLNGDSAQFFGCTFGSLADSVSGDKVRPAVLCNKGLVGAGLVSRDVLFDGCKFWKNAGGTTTAMVKLTADADIERVMEFHDCQFIANPLGSTPAAAIASATQTAGLIALTGDTCAFHCTKIATATGIFSGLSVKVATATIALQAS